MLRRMRLFTNTTPTKRAVSNVDQMYHLQFNFLGLINEPWFDRTWINAERGIKVRSKNRTLGGLFDVRQLCCLRVGFVVACAEQRKEESTE